MSDAISESDVAATPLCSDGQRDMGHGGTSPCSGNLVEDIITFSNSSQGPNVPYAIGLYLPL